MFKLSLIIAGVVIVGYVFRKAFRRAWYVLRTGDENPDFEALEKMWWGEEEKK